MNYYNWKTGRWETRTQCSETPISVASQPAVFLDKIEEDVSPKEGRIKQLFTDYSVIYMRLENKLYGRMLGKGHHLAVAALVRWLLRAAVATAFFGLLYAVYVVVMFVFQILMLAIASFFITAFLVAIAARTVFVI